MSRASPAPVDAGPFRAWLAKMRASLHGDAGTDVPCGDCVGCCVSSYYIPVRPQDWQARTSIPDEFLLTADGQPPGHYMMKYREDGTCPMLDHGQCSIYSQRPQTCRDYDCRIFAAAGLLPGGPEKRVINDRVTAWRFDYPEPADRIAHDAVLAAATFIREHRDAFPGGRAPTAPTGIAVLAVKSYRVFLEPRLPGAADIAQAIIAESRRFDAGELT